MKIFLDSSQYVHRGQGLLGSNSSGSFVIVALVFLSHAGAGGIGKTTALKRLAMTWAKRESEELKPFDLVFYLALNSVQNNSTLEDLILQQHTALKNRKVSPCDVRNILEGEGHPRVLLLFDGYDEYKKGSNSHIDNVLTKRGSVPNCCVLVSSRDTKDIGELRQSMNREAQIAGFDPERVVEYITKFLGNEYLCLLLIQNAIKCGIAGRIWPYDCGIMKIPMFLHMICVLFQRKIPIPGTKTGVVAAFVQGSTDWEAIPRAEAKRDEERKDTLDEALRKLGKVAWERLKEKRKSLLFTKVSNHR